MERGVGRCDIKDTPQTANKEARILASGDWVTKHVMMPANWKRRRPEFYRPMSSTSASKEKNDGAPHVLTAIYDRVANPGKYVFRVQTA